MPDIHWVNGEPQKLDGRVFVYWLWGTNQDRPLYIGMTEDIITRFAAHKKKKPWWRDVDHISVQGFDNHLDAHSFERFSIQTANPVHNFVRYESAGV